MGRSWWGQPRESDCRCSSAFHGSSLLFVGAPKLFSQHALGTETYLFRTRYGSKLTLFGVFENDSQVEFVLFFSLPFFSFS